MHLVYLVFLQWSFWTCRATNAAVLNRTPLPVTKNYPSVIEDAYAQNHPIHQAQSKRDDEPTVDPNDQSWITSWAAIGDSFSAGIGCGFKLDDACSRYNFSWPNLMNTDARMGVNNAREFQFLACSGATSPQILANQVPQIKDGVQVITVTAGGNDAGFANVLLKCIYPVFGKSIPLCDRALSDAGDVIRSTVFKENVKSLISGALAKLGADGRLYYVGYAPFFDAQSTQCNEVSWSTADLDRLVGSSSAKLSTSIRQQINVLVSQANAILDELIQASGDNVVFVDYSGWVSQVGGRFCEEGIKEPYGNNPDLFFYEWGTVDPWQETVDGRISARDPEQLITTSNSTLGSKIQAEFDEAQATHAELKIRDIFAEDTSETKFVLPDDATKRSTILMDSIKRVFHPTLVGHSLIANLVFYHMGAQRAGMLKKPVTPMLGKIVSSDCAVPEDEPGNIIAEVIDCISADDVPSNAWFDIDTGRQARDNFCKVVASKASHNIADAHGQDDYMTVSEDFPYISSQPIVSWIGMWVQNVGCERPTLYPSEDVCLAMLDAIMDQCGTPGTTKTYGGSAAHQCQEYHMNIHQRFTKLKTVTSSWNKTSANKLVGSHLPLANLTLI